VARIGGEQGLDKIVAATQDEDEAVRDEAVRMLSGWHDTAAVPHLTEIAKAEGNLRHQVIAFRGLARLAGPRGEQAADLGLLGEMMEMAPRADEKRLVVGILGGTRSTDALDLLTAALDDPDVADDAALATLVIAEMAAAEMAKLRGPLQAVMAKAKNPKLRQQAQELLNQ
jgi:HEAT repeat protein